MLSQPAAGPAAVEGQPPLSQQALESLRAAGPASKNSSTAPLSHPAASPVSQQAGGPSPDHGSAPLSQQAGGPGPSKDNDGDGDDPFLAPGPSYVIGQGYFAGLNPNNPSFKEEDYQGAQAERLRYPDASDFTYNFPAGVSSAIQGCSNAFKVSCQGEHSLRGGFALRLLVF